ncbi:hypothetical protein PBRA_000740 [Plasmodiophora brassicae]|uniref:Uncharacterized protein n=1 Tax=Plasmodiophora brassicae TaxID=37360 RepID=A0A0G4IQB0_PLABS|nr:hypothetical protein PBRA_000740 [Plasmodiophora brassicae]
MAVLFWSNPRIRPVGSGSPYRSSSPSSMMSVIVTPNGGVRGRCDLRGSPRGADPAGRTIARHHTYRDAESSHASVEDDRPRLARPGIHRRQQSDVRRQPLHDEDTSQFRKAISSILSDIGGIQAVRLADVIGNDGSLLRQLLNLAGRRRPAVDTYKSESGTGNIQSEIESLLTSLLRDARFEAALDLVPLCNDPETSAVAVHLKWSLVKGKRGARDKFASFLESHLSGDRFTEEVGAAVVLCLKGEPTQRFPKLLRFPAAWKGLLIATVHAPSPVKNSIFRELTWMILEEPTNSQTLLSQAEWPEWLLQPVVFENASTQQRDTHIQLRMHFVVILHFSMMMTSTEFETVFTRMLEHMCRWGSSGRDSASTIIGFLLSKLIRQKQLFRNDYTATYYSNLIRLLEIIANFVFCTWDWAECPGEFRPPVSYWDLPSSLALPDNAATRFIPTQHGYDPSYDVSEAVCKFLAAIGFNGDSEQAGFRVTALPEERPVVASLQHWAEFYRDAMLLLAVVARRLNGFGRCSTVVT